MKARLIPLGGVLFALCVFASSAVADEPFTRLSYDDAFARAKDDGLILLVDATATWCGPCKRMDRETWADDRVQVELAKHAIPVQIDVDEERLLAASLKIAAMPTVIAFKDGKEFDRHVGYLGPDEFLRWFEKVRGGSPEVDALVEEDERMLASDDVEARREHAERLTAKGEHERALAHYLWLWPKSRDQDQFTRYTVLVGMRKLADAHEPARREFRWILDDLYAEIVEPELATRRTWAEWFLMSESLEDDAQVLQWHRSRRKDDGGLSLVEIDPSLHDFIRGRIFSVLLRHERFADAGRLGQDLEAMARDEKVKFTQIMAQDVLSRLPPGQRETFVDMQTRHMRSQGVELYMVSLAGERQKQAGRIATLFLDMLDDAETRVALVEAVLEHELVVQPEHASWLDEAEELGANVAGLRRELASRSGG